MSGLRSRGTEDNLLAVIDGLKGFPEAITATYPEAVAQTCIVHLLRNSMDVVSRKDCKGLATAPKEFTSCVQHRRRRTGDGGVRGQSLGSVLPRHRSELPAAPEDTAQHPPVINPGHSTRRVGQQRLDDEPFLVCQFIPPARHTPSVSSGCLNHAKSDNSTRFLS